MSDRPKQTSLNQLQEKLLVNHDPKSDFFTQNIFNPNPQKVRFHLKNQLRHQSAKTFSTTFNENKIDPNLFWNTILKKSKIQRQKQSSES